MPESMQKLCCMYPSPDFLFVIFISLSDVVFEDQLRSRELEGSRYMVGIKGRVRGGRGRVAAGNSLQ